jgi:hypothetical protein
MEPLAIILGANATRAYALSALPDAPVAPPTPPRPRRAEPLRRATAAVLYRLAGLVEPPVASAGQPAVR